MANPFRNHVGLRNSLFASWETHVIAHSCHAALAVGAGCRAESRLAPALCASGLAQLRNEMKIQFVPVLDLQRVRSTAAFLKLHRTLSRHPRTHALL